MTGKGRGEGERITGQMERTIMKARGNCRRGEDGKNNRRRRRRREERTVSRLGWCRMSSGWVLR